MLLKVTGKILLDRNARYSSIHRIHGYCYYSRSLLLFTVYAITITVTVTATASSEYSTNLNIDYLTELNNKVKRQLTLGSKKLMEETASVIWVDLGYRLRSRNESSTAGFPEMTDIHLILLLLLLST